MEIKMLTKGQREIFAVCEYFKEGASSINPNPGWMTWQNEGGKQDE
jgi:hypothetical protein